MHACGHDVHSASLSGAARILHELRSEIEGTVKLIFQPAEERLPGGGIHINKRRCTGEPRTRQHHRAARTACARNGQVGFRPACSWPAPMNSMLRCGAKAATGLRPT